jgi:hypothetical protein
LSCSANLYAGGTRGEEEVRGPAEDPEEGEFHSKDITLTDNEAVVVMMLDLYKIYIWQQSRVNMPFPLKLCSPSCQTPEFYNTTVCSNGRLGPGEGTQTIHISKSSNAFITTIHDLSSSISCWN